MKLLSRLYGWYGKTTVRLVIGLIAVLTVGAFLVSSNQPTENTVESQLPTVRIATAGNQGDGRSIELIGTVKAVSQAQIESEVGGRVVRVNISLGDTVRPGQVIAELENASERAAVLQAEGVYEAAVAGSEQSDVGVNEAENALENAKRSAITDIRSANTTVDDIVENLVDELYTFVNDDPRGVRVDTNGRAPALIAEREVLEPILTSWNLRTVSLSTGDDLEAALEEARTITLRVQSLVEEIAELVAETDPTGSITAADISSYKTRFQAARTSLNGTITSLNSSVTVLKNSEEALDRARIAGSGNTVSSADAQVKQALGSLRAAQANLAKTILRSPIAGTVNTLSVDTGDFIGSFTRVAEVANNDALEITTFVGENDREQIAVGQTVVIEGTIEGVVTNIAPAVDPDTRKIEVKIATEAELVTGDTVTITVTQATTPTTGNTRLFIPITAVRFTATDGSVFTVKDNVLIAQPVKVGDIRGESVEIVEGISSDTQIVIDARGLTAGDEVEAITN